MKTRHRYLFILVLALLFAPTSGKGQLHSIRQEKFHYAMHYRGIPAANATFSTTAVVESDSQAYWRFEIQVKLKALLNSLFSVDNHYQVDMDRKTLLPTRAFRSIQQRNVRYSRQLAFDQNEGRIYEVDQDTSWQVPPPIYDLVGMLFGLRWAEKRPGDTLRFHLDCEMQEWQAVAVAGEQQRKKTAVGDFEADCWHIHFVPVQLRYRPWKTDLLTNQTVRDNAVIFLWISSDDRRLPVHIEYFRDRKLIDMVIRKDESDLLH